MRAEIITIGDELLAGFTMNTNAAYISELLVQLGIEVHWISVVGDYKARLHDALNISMKRVDIILLTGGLGPTHDDITKKVVADYFDKPLIFHSEIYKRLEEYFKSRSRKLSPLNRVQAEIPEGAVVMENEIGTAPGFFISEQGKYIFVMPGVPAEMRRMMQASVIPHLQYLGMCKKTLTKTIHTIGISESTLNEKFQSFHEMFPDVLLASLPNQQGVSLRLTMIVPEKESQNTLFEAAVDFVRQAAGKYKFGEDEDTLESVVGHLLLERKWKIAVAESCTGGLIAHRLTNIPGSSAFFDRGVIVYSNQSKIDLLGVPEHVLEPYGAVSAETAEAMAKGVRLISGSDIGLSITGIAGPSGGTTEKPVGLVFLGYTDKDRSITEKYIFSHDREMNKIRSAGYALELVRKMLQDIA